MAWKTLGCEAFSRSSAVTVVVGVGWVKPRELMREPVTTTSVMVVSSLAVGVAACCALAIAPQDNSASADAEPA